MIAFASLAVSAGSQPIVNPNTVAMITTEGTGARLHFINRPSLLVTLTAAAAAAALGFTVVASPSDLAGASGPTIISVSRSGDTQPSLINPSAISLVDPAPSGGATIYLVVSGESPAFVTAAAVATLAGLISASAVASFNRKGNVSPSLITRDQVATVVSWLNAYDGTTGAKLQLRDGHGFETASTAAAVLTALTA